ncbi:flagellar hook assembly protein FlgD [Paragemmobacter straminiformis]|uniref:Basal-body rod modification protein FlgD n=1 Tax=Paragemmobacter straminiformis TaxID=2045119 RepID=A0A842I582_9RHOB|nr:flagellar hook capping FlgD N-terminal domain-containing protein [Gemmobacter straminiformis]MBC2834751.1 flagellar biosynthesis protein FlgD [Gemmobacter straminiformis]
MDISSLLGTGSSAASTAPASAKSPSALGQQDFMTLMLAQLQNQNPLDPMENTEFLAQLAQFNTVSGISQVNSTLTSLTDQMRDFRVATATNLLGHQVLVPGNIARPDATGTIEGVADLPEAASSVTVTFSNAKTGELLNSRVYGAQSAGLMGFDWSAIPQELTATRTPIRIDVTMTTPEGTKDVGASVFAKVLSARAGANGSDLTLNIEDFGAIDSAEVDAYR